MPADSFFVVTYSHASAAVGPVGGKVGLGEVGGEMPAVAPGGGGFFKLGLSPAAQDKVQVSDLV